jgi:hypothetical protein
MFLLKLYSKAGSPPAVNFIVEDVVSDKIAEMLALNVFTDGRNRAGPRGPALR